MYKEKLNSRGTDRTGRKLADKIKSVGTYY
jgi:hypothetical protein